MSLPAVPSGSIIQAVFRGFDNLGVVLDNPLENVQWFQYLAGFGPEPAGIPLNDMTFRASGRWATIWRPFQSNEVAYTSCTLRVASSFIAVAPDRYRVVLSSQWTDNSVQAPGAVVSPSLPSFNAFGIRKITAAPGRGRQGQVRVFGVPQSSVDDNQILNLVLTALEAALVPTALNLNVSTGMAFSDALIPILINGKLVNTVPLQPPVFYAEFIQGFTPNQNVSSQITRKLGRRRS